MLPLALVPWLGAGLASAAVGMIWKKNDDEGAPSTGQSNESWGRYDEFSALLASAIFLIDGQISSEEKHYLEEVHLRAPSHTWEKIALALKEPNLFAVLGRWYRALDDAEKEKVEELLIRLIRVDNQITEEESAFLIQFSQIVEGNEPLELFLPKQVSEALPTHGLFTYLSKADFLARFPRSECVYREGEIYIAHPFVEAALERFSADDFQAAQEAMYEGLIGLMKDLGAKKVVLSDRSEETTVSETEVYGEAHAAGGAGPASIGVKGKVGGKISADDLMREERDLVVTFEGTKPRIIDRILQRRWHTRLSRKYGANKQYHAIIDGRFGDNRIKTFSHRIKSNDARKLAKAINAAASLDKKLMKGGVSLKVQTSRTDIRTVEKTLKIEFY